MALPTRGNQLSLDYAFRGQPFVSVAAKSGIDLDGLDYSFRAQPFWGAEDSAAGPTYTISCDQGSFSLTGQTAGLVVGRKIACDYGSFALSGQDAAFKAGRNLVCDVGSVLTTGQAAGLVVGRNLSAEAGLFTLATHDVDFVYTRKLVDQASAGNIDWLKRRKKPKVIRRSDFANQEEYREAVREALVSIPLSKVHIPDLIHAEDDDALLAVMLRVLH